MAEHVAAQAGGQLEALPAAGLGALLRAAPAVSQPDVVLGGGKITRGGHRE